MNENYVRVWVCSTSSTIELSKMKTRGTARIGLKISSLGKELLKNNPNGVNIPLRIVTPSGAVSTPYSDALITLSVFENSDVIYLTYNFSELGIYKVFCEDLSYTFQVGEGISDFSLISNQTFYGVNVKVYSDGLNVFVTFNGKLNGNSKLPTSSGSAFTIGTINSLYAPFNQMQSPIHVANNSSKIILESGGSVRLRNGSSSVSFDVKCSFYYPLKSRMP